VYSRDPYDAAWQVWRSKAAEAGNKSEIRGNLGGIYMRAMEDSPAKQPGGPDPHDLCITPFQQI
tara:strand:- start:408 stop:599 length:192 start_codon:yes stop_codon:yes gene_type:complete